MSPYDLVRQTYEKSRTSLPEKYPLNFEAMFLLHARSYFAFSTPRFCIYGRPVKLDSPTEQIMDPLLSFEPDTCDTWYIHGMGGDMADAWDILPYELPWIAFHRRDENELKFFKHSDIRRLTLSGNPLYRHD